MGRGTAPASRRAGGRSEAGAALVELALVAVVVAMLIVGALTGGLAYSTKITLTAAARTAARYATVHAMPSSYGSVNARCGYTGPAPANGYEQWLVDVACDAVYNAQGALDAGTSGRVICVTWVPAGTSLAEEWTVQWAGANAGPFEQDQGSCAQAAPVTQSSTDPVVEVVVQRTSDLDAVVFHHQLTLQSQAYGRYEQVQPS